MKPNMKFVFLAFLLCFALFAQADDEANPDDLDGMPGPGDLDTEPVDAAPPDSGDEGQETAPATPDSASTMQGLKDAADTVANEVSGLMDQMGVSQQTCVAGGVIDFTLPAIIALLTVATGIAIFYMAGNFLNSPQLIAMSKQEIYELIHTALIITLFFSFYFFTEDVLGISGSGQGGMYEQAMDYSMTMIQKISVDMFWLSLINTILYMFYDAPLKMGGQLYMAIHFNLGGVLKPFVDGVGTMASLLSFALGEWMVNLILLCFIKKHMLTLFLPIGIILKSFPQTRGGGNAIIALSIALFLVYPMMLVMNEQAYEYKYGQLPTRSGVEAIASSFIIDTGIGAIAVYGVILKSFVKTLPGLLVFSWGAVGAIDLMTDVIYTVFVLSIFLPLLNIFVTFTFAREIAKYFGTEMNIATFVKMI